MNMKIESRTKRVESAKSVARGMDLIIKTLTDARNEGQKLIEEAENAMDDEKFESRLNEATEGMFGALNKVVLAHMVGAAVMGRGIDLERMK